MDTKRQEAVVFVRTCYVEDLRRQERRNKRESRRLNREINRSIQHRRDRLIHARREASAERKVERYQDDFDAIPPPLT